MSNKPAKPTIGCIYYESNRGVFPPVEKYPPWGSLNDKDRAYWEMVARQLDESLAKQKENL